MFPHNFGKDETEKVQVAQMVRITIVHKPKPTPKPTPKPIVHVKPIVIATPQPVQHTPHPATPAPAARAGLAKSMPKTRYHSKRIVAHIAVAAHNGAGAGTGSRGTGRGSVGTSGNGTGTGGAGNGSGGTAAANEPCGFVDFINIHTPKYSNGAFYQDIRLMVHLGDGTMYGVELDYPFYYPSEAVFPWSDQNLKNPDYPVNFQFPPADKRAGEPPVVQYVMKHSTPDGVTTLKDCKGM